jgi:endoglucanase
MALLLACGGASAAPAADIKLNQLGFLPGAAKVAVVPDGGARAFTVVKAGSDAVVRSGTLGAAAAAPDSGETVRLADFSALTAPGRYQLRVAGLPDSLPFEIGATAYQAVNAAAIKAYYFNRAGIALDAKQAGVYARAAGHPDTQVLIHESAASPSRPAGAVISSPKGWYDAGDYNKYIVNSGIATYTLLAAYEDFPAFFRAQNLNIPESGNGVPDLLNEARWNLDWMLTMQDPADGGVYHKLTNKSFDGMVMPAQATQPRYVVQKSTAAALDFAAVMATASRVYAPHDKALAARMLTAAQAAWRWAQAHPRAYYRQPQDVSTGDYGDHDVSDEFAWAAAWQQSPYGITLQTRDYVWGSNAVVLNQAMVLLHAYRLNGRRAYLDAAQSGLDYVLGRNAVDISFVTGYGARSTMHPHHRPSEADGIAAPVPGFLAGGPQPGQQDRQGCAAPYPSALPATSYLDNVCSYASNEIAINWNAPLVYVSAALEALTPAAAN